MIKKHKKLIREAKIYDFSIISGVTKILERHLTVLQKQTKISDP